MAVDAFVTFCGLLVGACLAGYAALAMLVSYGKDAAAGMRPVGTKCRDHSTRIVVAQHVHVSDNKGFTATPAEARAFIDNIVAHRRKSREQA